MSSEQSRSDTGRQPDSLLGQLLELVPVLLIVLAALVVWSVGVLML